MGNAARVLGVSLGILTGNLVEWGFHKYVLHGIGRNKASTFSPHWHVHHRVARKQNMIDPFYKTGILEQLRAYEAKSLIAGCLSLLPFTKKSPWFAGTLIAYGVGYYFIHRAAHLDHEWSKKWLPWHRRHHMGNNQDANWCVVFPLADYLLGTSK